MKIAGYTDQCTECECCGKKDLKGTFIMVNEETGEDYYYGSSCAFKAFGLTEKQLWIGTYKELKQRLQDLAIEFNMLCGGKKFSSMAEMMREEKAFLAEKGILGLRFGKGKYDIVTGF